jgi:hypothetical protein
MRRLKFESDALRVQGHGITLTPVGTVWRIQFIEQNVSRNENEKSVREREISSCLHNQISCLKGFNFQRIKAQPYKETIILITVLPNVYLFIRGEQIPESRSPERSNFVR